MSRARANKRANLHSPNNLEPERHLRVYHAVVVVGKRAVVYEGVFQVYLQVLDENIVNANLIIGLARPPLCPRAVCVVTCLYVQFLLYYRRNG